MSEKETTGRAWCTKRRIEKDRQLSVLLGNGNGRQKQPTITNNSPTRRSGASRNATEKGCNLQFLQVAVQTVKPESRTKLNLNEVCSHMSFFSNLKTQWRLYRYLEFFSRESLAWNWNERTSRNSRFVWFEWNFNRKWSGFVPWITTNAMSC